jgi:hypothetical protein
MTLKMSVLKTILLKTDSWDIIVEIKKIHLFLYKNLENFIKRRCILV